MGASPITALLTDHLRTHPAGGSLAELQAFATMIAATRPADDPADSEWCEEAVDAIVEAADQDVIALGLAVDCSGHGDGPPTRAELLLCDALTVAERFAASIDDRAVEVARLCVTNAAWIRPRRGYRHWPELIDKARALIPVEHAAAVERGDSHEPVEEAHDKLDYFESLIPPPLLWSVPGEGGE